MRGKTQSSKVLSSHSSACGASSFTTNAWMDSRSRSCSSVKMKCGRLAAWSGLRMGSAALMVTQRCGGWRTAATRGRDRVARGLMLDNGLQANRISITPARRRVAALARRQYGVVSRRQLRDLGLCDGASPSGGRGPAASRCTTACTRSGHTCSAHGAWMAAVLACGENAVLSHAAAGALWGLRRSAATIIDVTVPGSGGRQPQAGDQASIVRATSRARPPRTSASP